MVWGRIHWATRIPYRTRSWRRSARDAWEFWEWRYFRSISRQWPAAPYTIAASSNSLFRRATLPSLPCKSQEQQWIVMGEFAPSLLDTVGLKFHGVHMTVAKSQRTRIAMSCEPVSYCKSLYLWKPTYLTKCSSQIRNCYIFLENICMVLRSKLHLQKLCMLVFLLQNRNTESFKCLSITGHAVMIERLKIAILSGETLSFAISSQYSNGPSLWYTYHTSYYRYRNLLHCTLAWHF